MMGKVLRFPRRRTSPGVRPCCGQCGRELTTTDVKYMDQQVEHELQSGVRLNLRVFGSDSDPHRCGFYVIGISDEGIRVRRFEPDSQTYILTWDQLMSLLAQWEMDGCEIAEVRPRLLDNEDEMRRSWAIIGPKSPPMVDR